MAAGYRNLPAIMTSGAATGLGYGAYKYATSGKDDEPQQQSSGPAFSEGDRPYVDFWNKVDGNAPPSSPAPAAQPQPQANPAGTPDMNDTTLMQLQRLMKSREYA
jgi:hypothetical protein